MEAVICMVGRGLSELVGYLFFVEMLITAMALAGTVLLTGVALRRRRLARRLIPRRREAC